MHTTDTVFAGFQRAVELALRLPSGCPASVSDPWPVIFRLGYERHGERDLKMPPLSAAEMQEFVTIASWIRFIKDQPSRDIVWAYTAGVPALRIAKALHPKITEAMIGRRIMWALGYITWKLNDGQQPPAIELPAHATEI